MLSPTGETPAVSTATWNFWSWATSGPARSPSRNARMNRARIDASLVYLLLKVESPAEVRGPRDSTSWFTPLSTLLPDGVGLRDGIGPIVELPGQRVVVPQREPQLARQIADDQPVYRQMVRQILALLFLGHFASLV